MSGIHQFVPMLHRGDAVGRHALALRDEMRAQGIDSRIYVELVDPDTASECEPASAYEATSRPGDVLVYQLATASQLAPWLASRHETLVVNYHNVTPPEHFAPWDNPLARHQLRAQGELALLAPRAALGVAVSAFNEAELRAAGYATTVVVPPAAMLPGPGARDGVGDGAGSAPRPDPPAGGGRWLAVGRLAPNKGLEHALMALAVTHLHHRPGATLDIVGGSVVPAYTAALERFALELGVGASVRFAGRVSDEILGGLMDRADVLLSTSAHEGFGVPLLEALARGLPVVANRAGALPEVLGEAGLLVDAGDPYEVADAVAGLLADGARRQGFEAAGRRRLAELDLATAAARFVDVVGRLR